ncbi:glycosyltransferase family 2 protein [Mucilaginibacter angelicae]|uniref:Glycosyltransferase family 2 protein n=1 Tax=Mucilaginibacter angelicae TaxID=869718 RepID=A0ABV6LEP1_9SPHI
MITDQDLMVSVCCTTYNHKEFIGQAIESFLMQETSFRYEIVIGDDCSTDGTTEILRSYKEKYPDKIKLILPEKNRGAHLNTINTLNACEGKYIALCDGDDYWTNPQKLQKQVDFLENNPEYIICCHYTRVIDIHNNTLNMEANPVPLEYTYHDLLVGRQVETKTATLVYHNIPEVHELFQKSWYPNCYAADKFFKLFATFNTGRKIYVMPEVMSCYRNHAGGIWSMIRNEARMEMVISDFNLIIRRFTYRGMQKKMLLLLYIKRYILFELRRSRLRKAFDTVKYLL